MDTVILNFKKKEIVADTKEDAIKIAEELFKINGNATQAFNQWKTKQVNGFTERDIKAFMLEYLSSKANNTPVPGVGYYIQLNKAVRDMRERPYKVTIHKASGRRSYKPHFAAIDETTGTIICEAKTRSEIFAKTKQLIKTGKFKGVAKIEKSMHPEKDAVVATISYSPSKNTRKGTWLVFGVEA